HWHFQHVPKELRSLHYIAGGTFYLIGEEVKADL
ncbi:flavin reductase, partial [Acinetobacter baumannii]